MKRYLRHLPALLGVALLIGAIYVVQKEFRSLKISEIKESLSAIPASAVAMTLLWTVLSYGVLTFYDRLGTIYAGHKVRYRRVAFASFCAYALSHNLGFAAVSGAAVRYRLYSHWGLTPVQIAKVVAFCSLTFGLGGLVLGGVILFTEPRALPFFGSRLPLWAFWLIGAAMLSIVAAYIVVSKVAGTVTFRGNTFSLPSWRMAIVQVALASIDVALTSAIFYALLPDAPGLTFTRFLACLPRQLQRRFAGQSAGRHRRVRYRHADGAGAVYGAAADRGRDPGVPPLLLHHPALPGRRHVRPATRSCCAAGR